MYISVHDTDGVQTVIMRCVSVSIFILTVLGNLAVLICVSMRERSMPTVCNKYVLSLVTSGFLMGVLVMPGMVFIVSRGYWPLSPSMCTFWLFLNVYFGNLSILNLCLIAYDRYLAIVHPFRYRCISNPRFRAYRLIAVAWCVAFVAPSFLTMIRSIAIHASSPTEEHYYNYTAKHQHACYMDTPSYYALFHCLITIHAPAIIMSYMYVKSHSSLKGQLKLMMDKKWGFGARRVAAGELIQQTRQRDIIQDGAQGCSVNTRGQLRGGESVNTTGPLRDGESVNTTLPLHDGETVNTTGPLRDGESVHTMGLLREGESVNTAGQLRDGESVNTTGPLPDGESVNTMGPLPDGESVNTAGQLRDRESVNTTGPLPDGESVNTTLPLHDGETVNTTGPLRDGESVNTMGLLREGESGNTAGQLRDGESVNATGPLPHRELVNTTGPLRDGGSVNTTEPLSDGVSASTTGPLRDRKSANTAGPLCGKDHNNIPEDSSITEKQISQNDRSTGEQIKQCAFSNKGKAPPRPTSGTQKDTSTASAITHVRHEDRPTPLPKTVISVDGSMKHIELGAQFLNDPENMPIAPITRAGATQEESGGAVQLLAIRFQEHFVLHADTLEKHAAMNKTTPQMYYGDVSGTSEEQAKPSEHMPTRTHRLTDKKNEITDSEDTMNEPVERDNLPGDRDSENVHLDDIVVVDETIARCMYDEPSGGVIENIGSQAMITEIGAKDETSPGTCQAKLEQKSACSKTKPCHRFQRSLRILGLMITSFMVCSLPFSICWPIWSICPTCISYRTSTHVFLLLYLNAVTYPLSYLITQSKVKNSIMALFCCHMVPSQQNISL